MPKPKAEIAGRILNRNEMSGVLGCSSMTLMRYVGAGCPCIDKGSVGRPAKFNELEVRRWVEDRKRQAADGPGDDAKRRYSLAAAELKEIQLAQKREELVPIEAVKALWADLSAQFRTRLLQIPGRLAGQIAVTQDLAQIERLIDDEVRAALTELSESVSAQDRNVTRRAK